MDIYINHPTDRSNQLCDEVRTPEWACGFTFSESDRIVRVKPDGPYYYYLYAYNDIFQKIVGIGSKLHTSLVLPDSVRADVFAGKCKILLDHSLEGFNQGQFNIPMLYTYLGEYLPYTIFATGDYLETMNNHLPTYYINYWERISARNGNMLQTLQHQQTVMENVPAVAKFKAICKNRLMRDHRIAIIKNIHDYDLVDKINYSFGFVTSHGKNTYDPATFRSLITTAARLYGYDPGELLAFVADHGEKNLHHEIVDLSINHASTVSDNLFAAHLDSYFEIIVETNFYSETIFHSEKTFKAIAWVQPFVLCAEHHSVQTLRNFGYDVFDDFIDHSYDNIKDHPQRMTALFVEIQRLCKISDVEWIDMLTLIRPRLTANVNHLSLANNRFNI
tara:strand:+ start:13005 stop:14174 length:1170 start_codon:yes stop_codon:yes gene_type:complete